MSEDTMACQYCKCVDFRFDHRHLICKDCGTIAIRENPKPLKKKAPTIREAVSLPRLIKHYNSMRKFRQVLNGF